MFPFPFMPPMIGMKPQRKPKAAAPTNPQATLYVRNLNEKLKPSVISEALLTIFSQFGKVIDIKYKKHIRHRGQAFVSFETSEIATEAMIKSQGFPLFEKPMDIQYAREPSFAVTALKGKNTLANHKRNREEKVKTEPVKKPKMTQEDHLPPNRILFIQNLAPTVTSQVLVQMFPGFREVRLVPGKAEIAFVEYESENDSIQAKQSLHGYRISQDREMKVTFARK